MIKVPVLKPLLPNIDQLKPYIEQIDANRYYSNLGPLTRKFEENLAQHFGVTRDRVVTSANGTLALTQVLRAFDIRPNSLCVMPSWTFVATPASAIAAGLEPYFIDVDLQSWTIRPEDVLPLLKRHDIGAVIPVSPFGRLIDLAAWDKFHKETCIPVVIDAAAGFDGFSARQRRAEIGVPVMVSLHATKVFGVGEGAVILTGDPRLSKKIQMLSNFGFYDSREAVLPGTNAKLNEYMAAVGLAAFDAWHQTREHWQRLSNVFERFVAASPGLSHAPGFNQGWVSSYGIVQLPASSSAKIVKKGLEERHIGTVAWWGDGCHRHPAYAGCARAELPVTEYLADHVLGLPFWIGLTEDDLTLVFDALRNLVDAADHGE